MKENEFDYTYTAPTESERREIDSIKRQYAPKGQKEIKLERLRYLDSRIKSIPQIVSIALGTIGTLIFGLGLSCVLEWHMLVFGILLMVLGTPVFAVAYPVHNYLYNKLKSKHSNEILTLSEELLNQQD